MARIRFYEYVPRIVWDELNAGRVRHRSRRQCGRDDANDEHLIRVGIVERDWSAPLLLRPVRRSRYPNEMACIEDLIDYATATSNYQAYDPDTHILLRSAPLCVRKRPIDRDEFFLSNIRPHWREIHRNQAHGVLRDRRPPPPPLTPPTPTLASSTPVVLQKPSDDNDDALIKRALKLVIRDMTDSEYDNIRDHGVSAITVPGRMIADVDADIKYDMRDKCCMCKRIANCLHTIEIMGTRRGMLCVDCFPIIQYVLLIWACKAADADPVVAKKLLPLYCEYYDALIKSS